MVIEAVNNGQERCWSQRITGLRVIDSTIDRKDLSLLIDAASDAFESDNAVALQTIDIFLHVRGNLMLTVRAIVFFGLFVLSFASNRSF